MVTFAVDSFINSNRKINNRIALLSNNSAINKDYISTLDILSSKYKISSIFAPEHGFYGVNDAGESVETTVDGATGIPIFSLYNEGKFELTDKMLDTFDTLIFDIQDLGLRFYTYISTLKLIIKALGRNNKKLIVFDRYPVLGGQVVEGNILDHSSESFVGPSGLPIRYALTIGELALFFNEENKYGCDIEVISIKGLKREYYFDDLKLPWIKPSPAIGSFNTALLYAGTCLFEGTNISEGRGTYSPFEVLGAPFIDEKKLSKDINGMKLPGIAVTPTSFKPHFDRYTNSLCRGIHLHVTNKKIFRPISFSLRVLNYIREEYSGFILNDGTNLHTRKLLGNEFENELNSLTIDRLIEKYRTESEEFKRYTTKYHIY
ncbi:MAG: DUF1343 domain-containing protein [Sphaerochaeta sp.]